MKTLVTIFLLLSIAPFATADEESPFRAGTSYFEITDGSRFSLPFKRLLKDDTTVVDKWEVEGVMEPRPPKVTLGSDSVSGIATIPPGTTRLPFHWRFILYATVGGTRWQQWVFFNVREKNPDSKIQWQAMYDVVNPSKKWTFFSAHIGHEFKKDMRLAVYGNGSQRFFRKVAGPDWLTIDRFGTLTTTEPLAAKHVGHVKTVLEVTDLLSSDLLELDIVVSK